VDRKARRQTEEVLEGLEKKLLKRIPEAKV